MLLELWIKPATFIVATRHGKLGLDFPIVAWAEGSDFVFAAHDNGKRRRLHTANSRQKEPPVGTVECSHCARAIDADQPIGLGAAAGSVSKRLHFFVGSQMRKGLADGCRRHGL